MDTLRDWSKDRDSTIRFYSGRAVYRNTFSLSEVPNGQQFYLDLGKVSAMAELRVNGQPAGGVWTAPWQVDVTKLVNVGENALEIEVVNTWANRLIGDSRLPAAKRRTWATVSTLKPIDALEPSGLLGPVTVKAVRY